MSAVRIRPEAPLPYYYAAEKPSFCNPWHYKLLAIICNLLHYSNVEIESISHKKLRKFVETGKVQGLIEPERLRDMIAFILGADVFDALASPPNFGFHALKGDRSGNFAMTVTRNWRLTFMKVDAQTIGKLDLEDYH